MGFKFGQIRYSEIEREESQEKKKTYKDPWRRSNERRKENEKV